MKFILRFLSGALTTPSSYRYFWYVSLVMSTFIFGHSNSLPLSRHYMLYMILTFAETTPDHIEPTLYACIMTNRVTSQCDLMTVFFRHLKVADTFFL